MPIRKGEQLVCDLCGYTEFHELPSKHWVRMDSGPADAWVTKVICPKCQPALKVLIEKAEAELRKD
jgi:ribosomal protein S27AE